MVVRIRTGEALILKDLSLPVSQRDPARNLFELAKFRGFTASLGRLRFRGGGTEGLSKATWRHFSVPNFVVPRYLTGARPRYDGSPAREAAARTERRTVPVQDAHSHPALIL